METCEASGGKVKYPTPNAAWKTILRMNTRKKPYEGSRVYVCSICGSWHITKGEKEAAIKRFQNRKRRKH